MKAAGHPDHVNEQRPMFTVSCLTGYKKRGPERSLLCCKQALIYYNIQLRVGICACQ